MIGSKRYKKYKSRMKRIFKEEMKIGTNFRSRFLNKKIRKNNDMSNGCQYKKLSRNIKYSWTLT